MHQLLYSCKICKQFLFHSLARSSPNCLDTLVKKVHFSLAKKGGAEEKPLHLYDDENIYHNEDYRQLHVPVMLKEVTQFLAPQKGQSQINSLVHIRTEEVGCQLDHARRKTFIESYQT